MSRDRRKECAHCGACLTVCPTYRATGREDRAPRGRLRIIELGLAGKAAERGLASCLLCGACEEACSRGLDITTRIAAAGKGHGGLAPRMLAAAAESDAARNALAPLARLAARAAQVLPPESGLRLKLGLPAAAALRTAKTEHAENGIAIFSGCLARHLVQEIETATAAMERFCHGREPAIPGEQTCCGLAAWSAGRFSRARELAKRNIEVFARAQTILTPCASCFHQLRSYPELLGDDRQWRDRAADFAARVEPFSRRFTTPAAIAALAGNLVPLPEKKTCLWHDPCHLRFRHGIITEPRRLLKLVPGLELREFGRGPRCCGMGGAFGLTFPELSAKIIAPALAELAELEVSTVITSCSGCFLQWQRHRQSSGHRFEVLHPALLIADLLPR